MFPLSYAQRRLWFFDQSHGPSAAYNITRVFRISGPLDQEALVSAFADVVAHHDALRTVYRRTDDDVRQVVVDFDGLSNLLQCVKTTNAELDGAMELELVRPFDLSADLPARAILFDLDDDEHRLLLAFHHIAMDSWSYGLVLRELATAYAARRSGTTSDVGTPAMRYADYAVWQENALGDPADGASVVHSQLAYWRERLAGLPEQLELPYDRARPGVRDHSGGVVDFTTSPDTHNRLLALADSTNCSMTMIGQAALATWLSRLGAGTDIPVGTVYAGRDDVLLEDLVGQFTNTVVLRHDLSGDPAFKDLVHRIRQTGLAAFDHATVPFDLVVEAVNPSRSLNRNPIFQVMSTWQGVQAADGGLVLDGVHVATMPMNDRTAKFDLTVDFSEHRVDGLPAGVGCRIEYEATMFNGPTARSMANLLATLLDEIGRNPGQRLSEIDLVGADERHLVLRTWNDTMNDLPDTDLPTMFSAQVQRTPEAVAVEFSDGRLTYAELNAQTNQLAHLLLSCGAGPEVYVAVVVPRTTALIAMLAVLKAGATFLPIEPEYPRDRISYILEDAQPDLVLTVNQFAASLDDHNPLVLDTPDTAAALADCPQNDPIDADRPAPLTLDSPAYIVYTSGSTGKPKGVVVSAKVLVNLVSWQLATMVAHPGTRVSQFSAISFDAFEQEILAALCTGQTVVVPSEDVRRDLTELARWLEREELNEFLAPDIVLRSVFEAATEQGLPLNKLRTVIQGGEPFQLTDQVREFHLQRPGITVYNHYGPSETHVITGTVLQQDPHGWPAVAPIGKPIWNCQTYVLDDLLRPVPVGVAGELYLAGAGLARGYLHRPGLTAQRFVANPFGAPGERMYHTGDAVRWSHGGELMFIGRVDDQIKIRGVRVELNEINSVMRAHPLVAQAATTVREDTPGDIRLTCYVVPITPHRPNPSELRSHAAAWLPVAVVPSSFVTLDALPLNSNGKLDRQNLPTPDYAAQFKPGSRKPRTPLEAMLCEAFAKVLGFDSVGIDDSFFDLGGHSLLAVRMANEIRTSAHVEISIRTLFENPTAAGLAAVSTHAGESPSRSLTAVQRPDRIPLSFAQQRLWFIDQFEGPGPQYNLPLLTLRLMGYLDLAALEAALTDVVGRHEILRTVYPDVNGKPFQKIIPTSEAAVRVKRVNVRRDELEAHVQLACEFEFDLELEPPMHAEVLSLSPKEHVFVLVAHHIAADGWSIAPLSRDLAKAYAARLEGTTPAFSPLPVQYADFTLWQRELVGSQDDPTSALARESAEWRETLADAPKELRLSKRPRPAPTSSTGAKVTFTVGSELYARLREAARAESATPFMALQAALVALLTRLGAGPDIVIGTTVAGRSDSVLDNLVGCFVNTLVLRTDTSGDPTFRELLSRVRATDLWAFQHQDLPFDRLVATLNPPRSPLRHPLVQVIITMWADGQPIDLPGLEVHDFATETGSTANFDLTFGFAEQFESGELSGVIQYATDLFDRETVDGYVAQLLHLLELIASKPEVWIGTANVVAASLTGSVEGLCEMFAETLEVKSVSPDDDFFDLGGHSLLAAELVSKICTKYQVRLKVRTLFFNPTPAQLSKVISHLI